MPDLVDIPGVELARVGTWRLSTGEETFTHQDFTAGIDALASCQALRRPILKLGHTDTRFDGQPAVGWADNLRLDGDVLRGDYRGLPATLAGGDGRVLASAYPNCSIEGFRDKTCRLGHQHPFVITGVALLGETEPGATLTDVRDALGLYGLAAAEDATTGTPFGTPAAPARVVTVDDVQRIAAANTQTPPASPAGGPSHKEGTSMPSMLESLRDEFGLPADATEDDILAKARERMTPPPPAPEPVGEVGDIEQLVAAAVARELDKATKPFAAALEQATTQLADLRMEKAAEAKTALFAAAVADGRIAPAERKTLEAEYDEAPAVITRLIAAKARGSAVPVAAAGYTSGHDSGTDPADDEFDALVSNLRQGGGI